MPPAFSILSANEAQFSTVLPSSVDSIIFENFAILVTMLSTSCINKLLPIRRQLWVLMVVIPAVPVEGHLNFTNEDPC